MAPPAEKEDPFLKPTLRATTQKRNPHNHQKLQQQRASACCFSFAAYAKTLIHHLRTTCLVPVLPGLSDDEFAAIESSLRLAFPPDLRAILREGLPSAAGFPNWRAPSSSLPILRLSHIWAHNFPCPTHSLGPPPSDPDEAHLQAQKFLNRHRAPVLVPVYRHYYIPSTPDSAAGNPVFSVRGGAVEIAAFDLAGFFHRFHFYAGEDDPEKKFSAPAWAAKGARRIDAWTELAEETERRRCVERTRRWWLGWDSLERCLEEAVRWLRKGGWGEEEVREMMMMGGGGDDADDVAAAAGGGGGGNEEVEVGWHVRELSSKLLRGGWSAEDVAYSLGFNAGGGRSFFLARVADAWVDFSTPQTAVLNK